MRAFVALDFDYNLRITLRSIQNNIRLNALKGSWVKDENFHLTLKFLGEIDQSQIDLIGQVLELVPKNYSSIYLKLDELGYFNRRKDQYGVIWIGFKGEINKLNKIYDIIEEGLEPLGFKKEKRPFRPHITLGRRVVLNKSFNQTQYLKDVNIDHSFLLDRLVLMRSEEIMGKRIYTPIKSYKLINDHR
ncbi:MAG: RNA 2',3'-cyclic phosphodiesterase [Tissierellia bacterium]|nr:RNA 2',3'-cyclic phosphodiesterase [Tissierellia bacterium]